MTLHFRSCFVLPILFIASGSFIALQAQQNSSIEVTTGRSLGPVNRLVFGQNIEAGDNAFIFSSDKTDMNLIQKGDGVWDPTANAPVIDVLNESKAVKMSSLRYPGGLLRAQLRLAQDRWAGCQEGGLALRPRRIHVAVPVDRGRAPDHAERLRSSS